LNGRLMAGMVFNIPCTLAEISPSRSRTLTTARPNTVDLREVPKRWTSSFARAWDSFAQSWALLLYGTVGANEDTCPESLEKKTHSRALGPETPFRDHVGFPWIDLTGVVVARNMFWRNVDV
jgi:hypothetical protein